jgi:hypothetical protein
MLTYFSERPDDEWCGESKMMYAHEGWLGRICIYKSKPEKMVAEEEGNMVVCSLKFWYVSRG